MYLVVAVAFAIAMLKLMFALIKSYIMVIVMLITAPVQILFNALPGSNAFGNWLKRTASYLIPFPVAAAMFIFAAVLVGDPTQSTLLNNLGDNPALNANHFFINGGASVYNSGGVWLPPFTLTNAGLQGNDILVLVGFVVFLMTPSAVKMAQEWMQVKESPYTAEAFANFGMGVKGGALLPSWGWKSIQEDLASRRSAKHLSTAIKQPPSLTDRRETQ